MVEATTAASYLCLAIDIDARVIADLVAQMAIAGSNMHRIGQILRRIRTRLADPIRVEELASMANMSPSSFHQHFKAVTAMSPVQYQKRLRLTEARRREPPAGGRRRRSICLSPTQPDSHARIRAHFAPER